MGVIGNNARVGAAGHLAGRQGKEIVTHHQGHVVVPARVDSHPPTAARRLVHKVVVNQRGRLDQLNRCGGVDHTGQLVAPQARRQQRQGRPQAFAAGAHRVGARGGDQLRTRAGALKQQFLDSQQIGRDARTLEHVGEARRRRAAGLRVARLGATCQRSDRYGNVVGCGLVLVRSHQAVPLLGPAFGESDQRSAL